MKKSFFTFMLAIVSSVCMTSGAQINSLCDEWNVWHESFESFGPINFNQVIKYRLTTDTIINGQTYLRLVSGSSTYVGALREGNNRDIYYVPAGSTNEFLLYAFNAQVGEVLNDLYLGGFEENGYSGRVEAISDGSPRLFTIRVLYPDGMGVEPGESFSVTWIEGVGSPETPYGLAVVPTVPADIGVYTLLCAYKNGEQVYTSTMGEQYGCEFNGIPSSKPYHLCDEWNILGMAYPDGHYYFSTFTQHLTTDTIIGGLLYKRLEQNGQYKGALREGKNRDIYYIPNGTGHEYLLYAFSAGEGEKLSNLWYGGHAEWCPNGYNATVLSISDETPRVFTVEVEYIITDSEGEHIEPWLVYWTEGIGMADGPVGQDCPGPNCEGDYGQRVLCAYKNGEQVFVSNTGEGYGCYYDSKQDAKNKLLGMWYLYNKEAVIGNYWNEQGEPVYGSREMEINGDFTYTFTDSMVLMVCPTCYSAPRPYTIEYVGGGHWLLTVPGMYDTPQPSDPSISGRSPITILQLSNQQIIWEYTVYGGDEGPETHHQYLLRNYPYDNSSDTIPLFSYTGDDPGSSTVDPVDPNQVVVTLKGDVLTIREISGEEITLELSLTYKRNQMPALNHIPETETFRNEVTITLTEEGTYTLELTNPSWGYTIYGTFNYPQRKDAIDQNIVPQPAAEKIIRNGQLLIRKGEKVYTVQGTAINE